MGFIIIILNSYGQTLVRKIIFSKWAIGGESSDMLYCLVTTISIVWIKNSDSLEIFPCECIRTILKPISRLHLQSIYSNNEQFVLDWNTIFSYLDFFNFLFLFIMAVHNIYRILKKFLFNLVFCSVNKCLN